MLISHWSDPLTTLASAAAFSSGQTTSPVTTGSNGPKTEPEDVKVRGHGTLTCIHGDCLQQK